MPPGLDELSAHWRRVLWQAQDAVGASAPYLADDERRRLQAGIADERARTARLLEALAREEHVHLAHRLAAARPSRRMLGLDPQVDACVFELEGVLTGAAAVHAAAWAETFQELLFSRAERAGDRLGPYAPFNPRTDYARHIHGRPRIDGVRSFLESRGIRLPDGAPGDPPTAETVHGLAAKKNVALLRRLASEGVRAHEGARHYLEAVRDAGLPSAVVCASAHAGAILERAGLAGLVDVRVDGTTMAAEHLRPWPEPDVLEAACEDLEVAPGRAAVFETLPVGVAAGRAAGFAEIVAVERHGHEQEMRRRGADVVVRDLGELLDPSLR